MNVSCSQCGGAWSTMEMGFADRPFVFQAATLLVVAFHRHRPLSIKCQYGINVPLTMMISWTLDLELVVSIYHWTEFVLTSSNCWNAQKFHSSEFTWFASQIYLNQENANDNPYLKRGHTFSFPSSSTICLCFSSSCFSRPSILDFASASCCFRLFTWWGK